MQCEGCRPLIDQRVGMECDVEGSKTGHTSAVLAKGSTPWPALEVTTNCWKAMEILDGPVERKCIPQIGVICYRHSFDRRGKSDWHHRNISWHHWWTVPHNSGSQPAPSERRSTQNDASGSFCKQKIHCQDISYAWFCHKCKSTKIFPRWRHENVNPCTPKIPNTVSLITPLQVT